MSYENLRKLTPERDVLGNEIRPGDYVVYGAAKGRCAGLNIGRVLSLNRVHEDYPSREVLKVKVRSVQEYFGRYRAADRDVTLAFTERMCVISASTVPDLLKEMLA